MSPLAGASGYAGHRLEASAVHYWSIQSHGEDKSGHTPLAAARHLLYTPGPQFGALAQVPPKEELGKRTKLPDTQEYLKASEEYVVEAILGHAVHPRKDGNQRMFRIRWEG
jgi:hypothetical protein